MSLAGPAALPIERLLKHLFGDSMADPRFTQPDAPLTEEVFMADRLSFWARVTSASTKVAVSVLYFCAWLWWCSATGFGFLHVLALPVVVGAIFVLL
jgi:hypothetical protein